MMSTVFDTQEQGADDDALQNAELAISLIAEWQTAVPIGTLETVIFLFRQALDGMQPLSSRYYPTIKTLAYAYSLKFTHTNEIADLKASMSLYQLVLAGRGAFGTVQDGDDVISTLQLAKESLDEFLKSTDCHSIETSNLLLALAVPDLSDEHPRHMDALMALSKGNYFLSTYSHDISHLGTSESTLLYGLECCKGPDDQHVTISLQLCATLIARYHGAGNRTDLQQAMVHFRKAMVIKARLLVDVFTSALGKNPDIITEAVVDLREVCASCKVLPLPSDIHPFALSCLAEALRTRFDYQGGQRDLDEAITIHGQIVDLLHPSHPRLPICLRDFGKDLHSRFEKLGRQDDINQAIVVKRRALALLPWTHPARVDFLNNLAASLFVRFQHVGQDADLHDAIGISREALALSPSPLDTHITISHLTCMLIAKFEHTGEAESLEEAIAMCRRGVDIDLPIQSRSSSTFHSYLASALVMRFQHLGHQEDLDEASTLLRELLNIQQPHDTAERHEYLVNLAASLVIRFQRAGKPEDLDEAIQLYREAINLLPAPHQDRSKALSTLSAALLVRYQYRDRKLSTLDEAISLLREALDLRPFPHPNRASSLNNLSSALCTRYLDTKELDNLDEAILLLAELLEKRPPMHPGRAGSLNNLASASLKRFDHSYQQQDLDDALARFKEALDLQPAPHPDRWRSLSNFALAWFSKYKRGGLRADLDKAIVLQTEARNILSDFHQYRAVARRVLGEFLLELHALNNDPNDLVLVDKAMSEFSLSIGCPSQTSSTRFETALEWAREADKYKHASALHAYDAAVEILPHLASLNLNIQSRQEALSAGSNGLSQRAAHCAIRNGHLGKAVEYLEAGRGVIWSQALHLRSRFDSLRAVAPELEDRLRRTAAALEYGSHRDSITDAPDNSARMTVEKEVAHFERLNADWLECLAEVRKINGFQDFLRPLRIADIQAAARDCPIVYLVPHDDGSSCLILSSSDVQCIPLPTLASDRLRGLVNLVQRASSQSQVMLSSVDFHIDSMLRSRTEADEERLGGRRKLSPQGTISSDDIFKTVLTTLWDDLVKPVVDCLKIEKFGKSMTLSRIRWCPTGLFTFLPIHAAGCYDPNRPSVNASDYIISSYTPTAGALLDTKHDVAPSLITDSLQFLAVVDTVRLHSAHKELQNIKARIPQNASLVELGLPSAPATVVSIAARLPTAGIVHFACHGIQDRSNPLKSALLVDGDERLTIAMIMQHRLSAGSLAFLCACETAMGDANLPDEAMSLGATLIFSGFRSVIATMWKMADADGPVISDTFYEELFREADGASVSKTDIRGPVQALDAAIRNLRTKDVEFRRWVPFIHLGE